MSYTFQKKQKKIRSVNVRMLSCNQFYSLLLIRRTNFITATQKTAQNLLLSWFLSSTTVGRQFSNAGQGFSEYCNTISEKSPLYLQQAHGYAVTTALHFVPFAQFKKSIKRLRYLIHFLNFEFSNQKTNALKNEKANIF